MDVHRHDPVIAVFVAVRLKEGNLFTGRKGKIPDNEPGHENQEDRNELMSVLHGIGLVGAPEEVNMCRREYATSWWRARYDSVTGHQCRDPTY